VIGNGLKGAMYVVRIMIVNAVIDGVNRWIDLVKRGAVTRIPHLRLCQRFEPETQHLGLKPRFVPVPFLGLEKQRGEIWIEPAQSVRRRSRNGGFSPGW
jgi:hypothetical protein